MSGEGGNPSRSLSGLLSFEFKKLERLSHEQQLVVTGVLVGLAAGLGAFIFERIMQLFTGAGLLAMNVLPGPLRLLGAVLTPALGGALSGWITEHWCPEAGGQGVKEVVAAIRERGGRIEGRVFWFKSVASAATIGFGGSAGQEGPIVQVGAATGSWVGQRLGVPPETLRTLAAAGASGGLAAVFGVPLAGVFFTMEVVLRNLANEAFHSIIIASVTATVTARVFLGSDAFFTPLQYQWQRPSDLVVYLVLALACAPVGILYMRSLALGRRLFERGSGLPRWLKPALGGLLVGLLSLALPEIRGTGKSVIDDILAGDRIGWVVFALLFGKILATSLTLGSGGSGGALMPSFFIGAATGGAYAKLLGLLPLKGVDPGALALLGMACVFTSAFQAPVTAVIMAFEISRDYGILLPAMAACVLAYLFSRRAAAH